MVTTVNIPSYDKDIASCVTQIANEINEGIALNHCISATGAHGTVRAAKDIFFMLIIKY